MLLCQFNLKEADKPINRKSIIAKIIAVNRSITDILIVWAFDGDKLLVLTSVEHSINDLVKNVLTIDPKTLL